MVLLSKLDASYKNEVGEEQRGTSSIRSMAVDAGESILCSGGRDGEILIWDLKQHPPVVRSCFSQTNKRRGVIINQVAISDKGNMGIACDGNMHVFDVEKNVELAFLKRRDRSLGGIMFGGGSENLGSGTGRDGEGNRDGYPGNRMALGLGLSLGGVDINDGSAFFGGGLQGSASAEMQDSDPFLEFFCLPQASVVGGNDLNDENKAGLEMLALSRSRLVHLDLRENVNINKERSLLTVPSSVMCRTHCENCSAVGTYIPQRFCKRHVRDFTLNIFANWAVDDGNNESSYNNDNDSILDNSLSSLTFNGDGEWICVGSNGGYVYCLDTRVGRVLKKWKAHDGAVFKIDPINRYQVLTVGKDLRAVAWDLRGGGDPKKISVVSGLPNRGPGINRNSVKLKTFTKESGKSSLVLYAVSGHKAAAAALPAANTPDYNVKARNFVDHKGEKASKRKLCIQSLQLLPMRQMLLMGCDDGVIRACV